MSGGTFTLSRLSRDGGTGFEKTNTKRVEQRRQPSDITGGSRMRVVARVQRQTLTANTAF